MKKLIARRPIQYMGRTYKCGEAVPTENPQMVEAWLRADSAVWTDTDILSFYVFGAAPMWSYSSSQGSGSPSGSG